MTLDVEIISALRSADSGVSGADLCRQLGVSRTAIWSRIEALRELGYDIAANPHTGYRLLASPDRLLAAQDQTAHGDLPGCTAFDLHGPRILSRRNRARIRVP